MKKRIALTLIVIMIATMAFAMLSACEFGTNDNKHLGKYCKYEDGNYNTDVWIELSDNNIWTDGEKSGIYQIDGSSLTFLIDGIEIMSGTLSNGILTIKNGESEIVYKKYNKIVGANKEYKVKFHLNYGDNEEIEKDTLNSVINFVPTRGGYSFDGWWTATIVDENAVLNSQWDVTAKVTNNELELWAKWSPIQYTITYHLNGGNWNIASKNQYTVEDSFNLDRPERAGYIFAGWYDNEQFGGNEIASIEEGNVGNKEFWAKWSITGYSVSYHLDGGINAVNNPSSYNINSSSIILEEASKTGYSFGGWYDNADFAGNAITQIDAGSIGNKELWAKWTLNGYTITYHLDGGINSVSNPSNYNINSATIVLEEASKTGYTFGGWYDNTELTGNAITQIDAGSIGNKELWAKWTLNGYTITYHLDGGVNSTNNPSAYNFDTPTIVLSEASKTGYTFGGWYDNAELTGNAITQIDAGSIGNKELWAKWTINQYTIDFDSNGGSEVASIVENYGASITEPDQPTKVGYTFGGWYKDAALSVEYVFDTMGAEDITLKAKWNPILYTIDYRNVEDATNNNPIGYYIDSETILLQPATKTGYTFGGWYKESTLVNKVTTIEKGSIGKIILYASWVKADDGYAIISAPNYSFLDDTTLKTTLTNDVEEYDFRGKFTVSANASWRVFTQSDCAQPSELTLRKTSSLSEGDNYFYVLVENQSTYDNRVYTLNLYKLHNYTVNYYGEGGKLLSTYQQMENTVLSQDDIPVDQDKIDQGYYIDQWFFDEAMTEEYDFVTPITKNQSVINLYARYNTIVYDIVYHIDNPQDYNLTLEYTVESDDIVLPSSARAHYLLYWYEDENYLGEQVTKIGSGSVGEKQLYAIYVPIEYTITYYLDGGENDIANPSQYNVETEDIVLEPATKTGYTFEGWYYDDAFTLSANTITTAVGEALKVYAHFLPFESQIADGNITIVGYSGSDSDVVVPSTIYRWQVVSIGEDAFRNNSIITSITIPDSVTSIGSGAFNGCSSLTSITIPNSVTSIGSGAFYGCSSLTSITFQGMQEEWFAIIKDNYCDSNTGHYTVTCTDGDIEWTDPNIIYELNGDSYTVTGLKDSQISEVVIPSTYNGKPVPSIGSGAFNSRRSLTSITIPDSVTSIGIGAFSYCSSLESMSIPFVGATKDGSSNTYFGYIFGADSYSSNSYYVPSSLKTVTITGGTSIGSSAFSGCSNLTSITIPNSVTSIGNETFYGCSSLTSINIPNSVTSIGNSAFYNCSSLTSITIPDSVTSIGGGAFWGCSSLTSITIPDSVTSIGMCAFEDCSSLTSITIPDSVTRIGDYAFKGCSNLTSVTIPNSVTSIGEAAFRYCSSLTSITIPSSVTSIGWYAFYDCYSLIEVYNKSSLEIVAGGSGYGYVGYYAKNVYTEEGGSKLSTDTNGYVIYTDGEDKILVKYTGNDIINLTLPSDITEINQYAFYECENLISITIPNSVTSIGDFAFSLCSRLISITIPDGVTSIGDSAFSRCSRLTSITIPNGVTSISKGAFSSCSSLSNITIPDGVTSIGDNAFQGCNSLTSITIPDGVTSIGNFAFYECSSLSSINLPDSVTSIGSKALHDTSWYNNQAEGLVYVGKIAYKYIGTMPSNTSIVINDGTLAIAPSSFSDCSGLTNITIPNSVMSIGSGAFYGCCSLTSITIPDSVTSIGSSAFCDCSNLTRVDITDMAKWCAISFGGDNANPLCYAHSLYLNGELVTDLVIPDGMTSIGDYAFSGFSSLTSITIPDSVTSIGDYAFYGCNSLTSITIPNSVTSIKSRVFYNCSSLTSVTIPDSVTSIGEYAFYGCSSLTNITIPNSVTSIGSGAFEGCSSLTSITIGNGVTSIGGNAFYGCSSLTSITIPDSVTSIGSSAFESCSSLTSVTIGSGVTSIVSSAFESCNSLTRVDITDITKWCAISFGAYNSNPLYYAHNLYLNGELVIDLAITEGVESIGEHAFYGCSSLISITIPDSVTGIGDSAFERCSSLTSITIPNSVTSIGYRAFSYCSSLKSLTISDGVTSIGEYAFDGCSSLTSITIPDSVTSIKWGAFEDCSSLTNITIPKSVMSIEDCAFQFCYSLIEVYNKSSLDIVGGSSNYGYVGYYAKNVYTEEGGSKLSTDANGNVIYTDGEDKILVGHTGNDTNLTLPSDITKINKYAFSDCKSLTSIVVQSGNTKYHSNGNCLIETKSKTLILGCATSVIPIDGSVTSIGSRAFYGCSSLTSITIPDSVTSIGEYAFYGCSSLTSITIPDSVTSIGSSAFDGCSSLTSITIPNSVTSIKWGAFRGCSSLTSITIPDSVTSIGVYAFYNCSSLTSITIPNGVTSIGSGAFENCTSLTSITIPDSVTSIGMGAFEDCSSLTSITIPFVGATRNGSSNTYFGYIFGADKYSHNSEYVPSSLKTVTITGGTSIGSNAFSYCRSLTSITIPSSVTSIGRYAFYYCSSLTSITIPFVGATKAGSSNTHFGYIFGADGYSSNSSYVPSSLKTVTITGGTSIGSYAFHYCSSLTNIIISDSVTSIGSAAFLGCSSLTSITIPDSVTSIGESAFSDCSSLTSITIPNSVTSIEDLTFSGCSSLTSITFQGTQAQWNAISKGYDWNNGTGNYTIHCTDGDIAKQ